MISFSRLGQIGNLGNQLFQIASMCGIAESRDEGVTFPASWPYWEHFVWEQDWIGLSAEQLPFPPFREQDSLCCTYSPESIPSEHDISGYLQSYKYFSTTSPLRLRNPLLPIDAVAISIRRGDFVGNWAYAQVPIEYYIQAYEQYFPGMKIMCFSDDIPYCKMHFAPYGDRVTYVDNTPINQLRIGAACKYHIISNSTFSWWMAWLSKQEHVIRPAFNFSDAYRVDHDETDYWPENWEIFDRTEYDEKGKPYWAQKWDLSDVTFTIPVAIDSQDRMKNIGLSVCFLQKYFHCSIHIMENGTHRCGHYAQYGIQYTHTTMPNFHRTKMLNDMAKAATTPYVCNFDCDTVFTPLSILEAVRKLRAGADIVYPFDGTVWRILLHAPERRIRKWETFRLLEKHIDVGILTEHHCDIKHHSVGHLVMVNRDAFFSAGGENEHFISYGPEDWERYKRFTRLGLRVERVPGMTFHLNHALTTNSCNKAPFYDENHALEKMEAEMTDTELRAYVNGWEWAKEWTSKTDKEPV